MRFNNSIDALEELAAKHGIVDSVDRLWIHSNLFHAFIGSLDELIDRHVLLLDLFKEFGDLLLVLGSLLFEFSCELILIVSFEEEGRDAILLSFFSLDKDLLIDFFDLLDEPVWIV